MCSIVLKPSTAMNDAKLPQFQILLENDEFLLPKGPITLVDGESMKNNARFVQNLDEKLREKVCEKMQNGSRSEIWMC